MPDVVEQVGHIQTTVSRRSNKLDIARREQHRRVPADDIDRKEGCVIREAVDRLRDVARFELVIINHVEWLAPIVYPHHINSGERSK